MRVDHIKLIAPTERCGVDERHPFPHITAHSGYLISVYCENCRLEWTVETEPLTHGKPSYVSDEETP